MTKPRLLYWGDSPTEETGFARVGRVLCHYLSRAWDVSYLGLSYSGDPHPFPYRIYPAQQNPKQDMFGYARARTIVEHEKPDVVLMNTDTCVVAEAVHRSRNWEHRPKIVAYSPIDSPGVKGPIAEKLSELDLFVSYTEFGLREMRAAGFWGNAIVAPHGIEAGLYQPHDKAKARAAIVPGVPADAFLVGNVNRNQPRKRLDLTVMYFAEWVRRGRAPANAALYLHCAKRDAGWDLSELAKKLDVADRVFIAVDDMVDLPPESMMPLVYSALDVQVTTTLGEGWGLTQLEGMSCGTPQIVPDWSALGEWAKPAARLVPCTGLEVISGYTTFGFGGVVDKEAFLDALDEMAGPEAVRADYASRGLSLARDPRFSWASVAETFHGALLGLRDAAPAERPKLKAVG